MDGTTSSRRQILVLGLGAWILLSAIVASQNYVEYQIAGTPVPFLLQLVWMLAVLAYWVAAAPLVLLLYRRFPFHRDHLARHILVHLAAASVITLVHAPLVVAVTYLLQPFPVPPGLGFWKALGFTVTASFHTGFLLYWTIVGSGVAYASYRRERQRQLAAARLEVELGEARLRALEAQIHPHFLFNALNTVTMMIRSGEPQRAVSMVAQLGGLLRASLESSPQHEVELSREVELARRYLQIEKCRFDETLEVEIDVPAVLEQAMVPHLVLQPLVENAVRHGIANADGPGKVRIAAKKEDESLLIEILDNGPGEPSSPGPAPEGDGVGLENVRSRLAHLYGPAASLSLESRADGGTIARIAVPFHVEKPSAPLRP